ncbi:MAG: DUF192 domain-containing protein [Quisquiliibacterium sp.]
MTASSRSCAFASLVAAGAIRPLSRSARPILQLLTAALVALSGIVEPSALAQTTAQPRLPTVELQAGIHLIRAEVAASEATRTSGLMFRQRLGPNEGMLFVFQSPDQHCFWMRNTPLALSIAFIDPQGKIVNIEQMMPRSDQSHCAARPVPFALEMEQGWFKRRGFGPGSQISGPPGMFRKP